MSLLVAAAIAGAVILFFYLLQLYWEGRHTDTSPLLRAQALEEEAQTRAEALLRASVTPHEYSFLLQNGYLEIPSRLYANRVYQIPRKRRRVRVYEVTGNGPRKQQQKLGELCLIACEPVPDADVVLTHKWLLEADEETYLATANWISGNWSGGGREHAQWI